MEDYKKVETDRTVHIVNKGRSGRARGARAPEKTKTVRPYAAPSPKVQDLKTVITRFFREIPAYNFVVRLNECLNRRGAHIEHSL